MNKYERLLFILNLIRTTRGLTAKDLARRCEVTERTIFRDITALSSANIPIYYDCGYRLLTGSFLPTLNFDLQEYLTAREALRTTPLRRLPEYRKALKAIEAKIDACLAPQVKDQKKQVSPETRLTVKARPAVKRNEIWFALVERAINERLALKMIYDSIDSGQTEREIEPIFTLYTEGKFYVVAYCLARGGFRTFRISRIRKLEITSRRFKRHSGIDPKTYFENSWSVFGGDVVDVKLEFSGRAARVVMSGSYLVDERKTELPGGELLYEVRVSGIEEIGRWVMGFGDEVRVLAPSNLRDWIVQKAKGTINLYEHGGRAPSSRAVKPKKVVSKRN